MIEAAAVAHEPHRIAFYLYDLASEFHALWTRGRDLPYLRFIINNDAEITKARLALVQGVVSVLASGLGVLVFRHPTRCDSSEASGTGRFVSHRGLAAFPKGHASSRWPIDIRIDPFRRWRLWTAPAISRMREEARAILWPNSPPDRQTDPFGTWAGPMPRYRRVRPRAIDIRARQSRMTHLPPVRRPGCSAPADRKSPSRMSRRNTRARCIRCSVTPVPRRAGLSGGAAIRRRTRPVALR